MSEKQILLSTLVAIGILTFWALASADIADWNWDRRRWK